MNLRTTPIHQVENIKILGRTTVSKTPVTLFWTASGIEANVKASEFWIELEADYSTYEPWISVLINGVLISRQMVTKGRQWLCIFRNLNGDTVKHIQILKDVQAMADDSGHCLQVHAVKCDGKFEPLEEPSCRIEFIGDSITSGEGAIGSQKEEDWVSMWFSAVYNYATITSRKLGAECRILSQSGWGVLSGWDNNPNSVIPPIYEKVCGLLKGERNSALGCLDMHDFSSWQPDVIVINLGTNDYNAFVTPGWQDPHSGVVYKQKSHTDGTFDETDLEKFQNEIIDFLSKLRKCNSKAHLLWAYGILGNQLMPAIESAAKRYQEISGDQNVSVLLLPEMETEGLGARFHPGLPAHEAAATALSAKISCILENKC